MNLFASLVDRALGRAPVLQRRRPGLFEPAGNAVPATRDNPTDFLREEQSYAEARSSAGQETTTKITNIDPEDSRAKSQPASSNTAATVTPRATDITLVEEQPAFKPVDREAHESDDGRRSLPIREQTLTQDTPQQLSQNPTASPEPSLETIVETKPEPQVLQRPAADNPFDEVDLMADVPEQAQSSVVNNIVVLRTIAQKQNSDQIDEARLLKPVTQRRPTRQQMQRSAHARLQSEHPQMETPAQPTINVTIGRVEVRASAPAKRADAARPSAPKLSLEEYLRGRSKGN